MEPELTGLIVHLTPLLARFCQGDYGIALGGAHAKGMDDRASDLDLYVFARQVLPCAQRTQLTEAYDPEIQSIISWGEDAPFIQGGTDFVYQGQKVECWLRNIDYIDEIIAQCQAGSVTQTIVTWTVMGFYNHCALSDLRNMASVDDPQGVLAHWKTLVSDYPPRLREAILTRHMNAAKFWPQNFHYLSAIKRGDILYVQGIVNQVAHNLFQVLFALNQVYFPGDKKLDLAIDHLPLKPADFTARVKRIVAPQVTADKAFLEWQCEELNALVNEVEALMNGRRGLSARAAQE
jgi:hypothetical protein